MPGFKKRQIVHRPMPVAPFERGNGAGPFGQAAGHVDDAPAVRLFDGYLYRAGIEIVAVTARTADLAYDAYRTFGRGQHAAGLDFGDCFAYALARETNETLLFKGGDFSKTDIVPGL